MRKIPVDRVVDGLVLARAVEDRMGRLLLMKGDTLQARYRDKLREWGISELYVEGEETATPDLAGILTPPASPSGDALELEALQRRLDRRFSDFPPANTVMTGLKLLALKHLSASPKA